MSSQESNCSENCKVLFASFCIDACFIQNWNLFRPKSDDNGRRTLTHNQRTKYFERFFYLNCFMYILIFFMKKKYECCGRGAKRKTGARIFCGSVWVAITSVMPAANCVIRKEWMWHGCVNKWTYSTNEMIFAKIFRAFTVHLVNALNVVSFEHFVWQSFSQSHRRPRLLVVLCSKSNPFKWNKNVTIVALLLRWHTLSFKS